MRAQGRIFEAAVLGALLYATEERTCLQADILRMQRFVGSCCRSLACKAKSITTRGMEEEGIRMTALDWWLGIDLVEVMIAKRTMSYLGHIGRYLDERWG